MLVLGLGSSVIPGDQCGQGSLFDGSYDWHSCIFAHWALLAQARRDGDSERAERILGRLPAEALAEEQAEADRILCRAQEPRHRPEPWGDAAREA